MDIFDALSKLCTYSTTDDVVTLTPLQPGIDHINIIFQYLSKDHIINLNQDGTITIKKLLNKRYKTAYTSGCYDLLHFGHLNIFQKTKEQCDYLLVGVSTDELILSEKGHKPIIPFEERIKMVKAIKYVDEVIPQTDKNKQKIVDQYHIDAISVGDDWKGKYPKVSCDMIYIPYTKSVSSTILKNTLKLNQNS